jgi:hypothetical protein
VSACAWPPMVMLRQQVVCQSYRVWCARWRVAPVETELGVWHRQTRSSACVVRKKVVMFERVCVFVGSTVCEFVLAFESVMSRQEFELVVASCASVCSVWMVCVWLHVRVRGKCAPCVASLCNAV